MSPFFFRRTLYRSAAIAGGFALALPAASALAAPINVGSGPDSAEVLLNWPDGFVADYDVHFGSSPSSTIDGYDLTQAAAAGDPNLNLQWTNYPYPDGSPDYFLNIASYPGGHIGDGGTYDYINAPNNYWAEWINDNDGTGWFYGNGASVDTLTNNEQIGWVFGSTATPVPEPAGAALLAVGGLLLLSRKFRRRATIAATLLVIGAAAFFSPSARAADSVTVVPGTLTQGTVKASLGAGTSYDVETNNLGDWPLTTGGSSSDTGAISFENPDYNANAFGGNANTIIAFGTGGGVTLQFATPITPHAGEKDLGIFTAQAITAGAGSLFNSNMEAAILVSADDTHWFTLTGSPVASPTTYTGATYSLNAPTMAYNFVTGAAAQADGAGTSLANLNALTIANFTSPMPDDSIFNSPTSTNAQRLALTNDTNPSDYAEMFGATGGGNWFDISGSGLSTVDYVRLNGDANVPSSGGVRLDAVFANSAAVPVPEPTSLAFVTFSGFALLRRRPR